MASPKNKMMASEQKSASIESGILDELRDVIASICQCDPSADGLYKASVRAALAKNYEVNCLIANQTRPQDAFALTASLRGLCEDIICLKYIGERPGDRDEIVKHILWRDAFRYMDKQQVFFGAYRPGQPILPTKDMQPDIEECSSRLRELGLPRVNVHDMALHSGLSPLYEYLYAATSSYVHFSPHNLMRMGWEQNGVKGTFHYSTANFELYYYNFNRVYAALLFVIFCAKFSQLLNAREQLETGVEKLKEVLKAEIRWPEMITHEEMNKPPVSPLWYAMGNSISANRESELERLWDWDDLGRPT